MRNYIFGSLVLTFLCCQGVNLCAQTGPTCRDINLPVQVNDSVNFLVQDFVSNAALAQPMTIQVMNPFNGVLLRLENAMAATPIEIPACRYLGKELNIMAGNAGGWCNSVLTFTQSHLPVIKGRSTTVLCSDSLVKGGHIDGSPPLAEIPCEPDKPADFVSDWVMKSPCEPGNDIAKVIFRTYAASSKDGIRTTAMDTITVVKLPPISLANTYCSERDTAYCGDSLMQSGPFMVYEDPITSMCDTLYFLDEDGLAKTFDELCGLQVKVDELPFPSECGTITRITVQIKQTCPGTPDGSCTVPTLGNVLTGSDGYWRCTYWHMEIDTVAPIVDCGMDMQTIPTSTHSCETQIPLPPITAIDSCHEVILVKAKIASYGTVNYEKHGDQWVSTQPITLPRSEEPIEVIFEAFDVCHNVGTDTCFFQVVDQTAPIAVAVKKVNVNMSGKKAWVSAESFNENSWDNCEISLILARRTDWVESCIDLCNNITPVLPLGNGDTLWRAVLDGDSLIDPVERHYQQTINWLLTDGATCGPLVSEAWHYALLKYATVTCKEVMTAAEFDIIVEDYLNPALDPVQIKQIGGGWSYEVPISCEDVCNPVQVELLVMDYWCNWSRSWSQAWIDDKGPLDIAKDVSPSIEISCKSFKDLAYDFEGQIANIATLVAAGENGSIDALEQLNEVFGTYRAAWRNDLGQLVDADGNFVDLDVPFTDSTCRCIDTMITKTVYDSLLGWVMTTEPGRFCFYEETPKAFADGVLVVSCPDNVHISQQISSSLDACGQGWVERTWKLWKQCDPGDELHTIGAPDTTTKKQKIWIGNQCELDSGMFEVPEDAEIEVCVLEYDGNGNVVGAGDPDSTGRPTYIFDDDCRLVGIGHFDKVLSVINDTTYCFKIIRTWCFADWCNSKKPSTDDWPNDVGLEGTTFKYVQTILVKCTCTCMIECSDLRDTTIACEDIPTDLTTLYPLFGTPTIFHPDPLQTCDEFSLENETVTDTNACGIGTIARTWYLLNEFGMRTDSCSEVITLLSDDILIERQNSYRGDAEPFNCSDDFVMDPVVITGACPQLGAFAISHDSPYAPSGPDASGTYPVGVTIITYQVTNACLETMTFQDTVTVIDDVNPTVVAFSDGCVFFSEWEDDFASDPMHPDIRMQVAVQGMDNCAVDTVLLVDLDSTFIPDPVTRDTIIYTYKWQAIDTFGLLSPVFESFILVSDDCNKAAQQTDRTSVNQPSVQLEEKTQMQSAEVDEGRLRKVNGLGNVQENVKPFALYQNRPNPFNHETVISFNLPVSSEARISIFDVTGKTLKRFDGSYTEGYHEISIQKSDLGIDGIVYYRLETDSFTATRKMVVLD